MKGLRATGTDKKRYQRIILFIVSAVMAAVMLCGCGVSEMIEQMYANKEDADAKNKEEQLGTEYQGTGFVYTDNFLGILETEAAEETAITEEAEEKKKSVLSSRDYQNDRAWIEYTFCGEIYIASIDKNGNEVFRLLKNRVTAYEDFFEEYAYISLSSGALQIINKNGEVQYTLTEDTNGTVLAYGGGYVLCSRNVASFDANYDVYEIYDPQGNVHEIDTDDSFRAAHYCGCGVFEIALVGWISSFYHAESKEWIVAADDYEEGIGWNGGCMFNNGVMCYGVAYTPEDRCTLNFITLTEDGVARCPRLVLPDGYNPAFSEKVCSEGVVLVDSTYIIERETIQAEADEIAIEQLGYLPKWLGFGLSDTDIRWLPDYYANRLDKETTTSKGISPMSQGFQNGRIAVPMIGDDKQKYIAILDKQWNEIMPVTRYSDVIGFDGYRLVLVQDGETVVYDENGVKLFTAEDIGVETIGEYRNEVAMVAAGLYIDRDGKLLFEEITFLPDGD